MMLAHRVLELNVNLSIIFGEIRKENANKFDNKSALTGSMPELHSMGLSFVNRCYQFMWQSSEKTHGTITLT